tara:strand:+ start:378 stop:638 length:261 start_codon:yes stop_codon:yes gene_type:complete
MPLGEFIYQIPETFNMALFGGSLSNRYSNHRSPIKFRSGPSDIACIANSVYQTTCGFIAFCAPEADKGKRMGCDYLESWVGIQAAC